MRLPHRLEPVQLAPHVREVVPVGLQLVLERVGRERLGIGGREGGREARVGALEAEREVVASEGGRHARLLEELLDRQVRPGHLPERGLRDVRHAGEKGLRLGEARRIHRPGLHPSDVRCGRRLQKDVGGRLVDRGLPERDRDGDERHEEECREERPLAPREDVQVVEQARCSAVRAGRKDSPSRHRSLS